MLEQNYSENIPEAKNWKKIILFVILALFVLGVIVAVWWFFFVQQSSLSPRENLTNTTSSQGAPQVILDPVPNDKDRDGINNEEEEKQGLSASEFDTDSDGLSDSDEINIWKTDPKKLDTDADGFGDGFEVLSGYNPRGEGTLP